MHTYARSIDGVRTRVRRRLHAKFSFTRTETLLARTPVAITIRRTLPPVVEQHFKREFIFEQCYIQFIT